MPKPPKITMTEYALAAENRKLREASTMARDFLRDRFGHAEAQHDPDALHVLANLNRALATK